MSTTDKTNKKKLYALGILILMGVCFIVSRFFFQFVLIDGKSMEPTLKSYSLIVIRKYDVDPDREEIIAFYSEHVGSVLVKRVIGLPGDEINIENGNLYINNELYKRFEGQIVEEGDAPYPMLLGENEYFVIGDNQEKSIDSRFSDVGIVRRNNIIGEKIF